MNSFDSPTLERRISATQRPASRRPVMFQRWEQLLFLHWTIDPAQIQKTLPPGLQVDTHDGRAYLGIVPFFMRGVRPRFCPPVPGLSNFPELNLRTYVHDERGRPGVWFYSLDAYQWLAVRIARTFFDLPYVYARMKIVLDPTKGVRFQSRRTGGEPQEFRYKAKEQLNPSKPGSLEYFLTERYLLFSHNSRKNQLYVGQVHHVPYSLYAVHVSSYSRRLLDLNGFSDPQRAPDHALYSPGVDVSIFGLKKSRR